MVKFYCGLNLLCVVAENSAGPVAATSPNATADQQLQQEVNAACNENNGSDKGNSKEDSSNLADFDLNERYES